MAFQSEPNDEMLARLAEASGWTIPAGRMQEIAGVYRAIFDDTRLLRAAELGDAVPAIVFEAE
jgi:hypothetical protein